MKIPTSFRPLFRGCFLFVFLIEFYKYSLLSKVSVPSFGDVFYFPILENVYPVRLYFNICGGIFPHGTFNKSGPSLFKV